jgi:hypothetical protein
MGRYWGFQEGNVYVTSIASIHYYIACFVKSYGCKIKATVSRITQHLQVNHVDYACHPIC